MALIWQNRPLQLQVAGYEVIVGYVAAINSAISSGLCAPIDNREQKINWGTPRLDAPRGHGVASHI